MSQPFTDQEWLDAVDTDELLRVGAESVARWADALELLGNDWPAPEDPDED